MIKPPVVYVAGMLRQTGTYVTTDDWVWMLDGMGQRPFYPPNVSGWEQNEAWLSTSSLRMRFQAAAIAPARCDQGRLGARAAHARAGARALARVRRQALDEQGDDLRARLLQPSQRRGPQTRRGRSSTTIPSASACCARCCWPALTRRSADAASVQRLARRPRAAARRARPRRADPRRRARRARGVRARRPLAP